MPDELKGLIHFVSGDRKPIVLYPTSVMPEEKMLVCAEAAVELLDRKNVRGRARNLAALSEIALVFLEYDREGIQRPTRGLTKMHFYDGRLIDVLRNHCLGGFLYIQNDVSLQNIKSNHALAKLERISRKPARERNRIFKQAEVRICKPQWGDRRSDLRRYFRDASLLAQKWKELGAG
jgi:hypothetical protein